VVARGKKLYYPFLAFLEREVAFAARTILAAPKAPAHPELFLLDRGSPQYTVPADLIANLYKIVKELCSFIKKGGAVLVR
jgi:hypothetical protein